MTLFPGYHGRAPTDCWILEALCNLKLSAGFPGLETQSQYVERDSLMHSFLPFTVILSRIFCILVSILLLQNPHRVKDYSYNLNKMDWAKSTDDNNLTSLKFLYQSFILHPFTWRESLSPLQFLTCCVFISQSEGILCWVRRMVEEGYKACKRSSCFSVRQNIADFKWHTPRTK